ncbi:MAG: glycosyl transferase family 2 [Ignavibacteria bacterium]|nr:glycosyl transferase family 2 [Ignavibacteria bacterium]
MVNLQNITVHFAGRYLFEEVSFAVGKADKIGLIGRNGTGKTTLLRIIAGESEPESGTVSTPNDFTIGYLPQEGGFDSTNLLFDEAASALDQIKNLEAEIETLTEQIGSRTDYDSKEYKNLLDKLTESNDRFRMLGGASAESEIERILLGLGFERTDFYRPMNEFSGGWQMRLELSKLLLRQPDCLLLDEPTNHLDIESVRWLEEYLKSYRNSILLVSHDRFFLDSITNRTIEISLGKIYDLNCPYTEFIERRELQRQHQVQAYQNQQREIAQTERFIERFRSKATLASRVQSRVKQLEKIERIELEDEDYSSIRFRFPEPPRSGRLAAEAIELSKSYGDKLVLKNVHLAIERGEKIAFVGKNGEGKSTMLKILSQMDKDIEGELTIGYNVQTGYYAQNRTDMLIADDTVFETIDRAATGEARPRIRSLLGAFLFGGDSIYKKVKVLSGGEKSRLSLARLMLEPINLLLLDEPTNHLDFQAKDVLKNALLDFTGAMIIVSHDRDFLHGLTTKTVEFRNKSLKEYIGDINEYLDTRQIEHLAKLEEKNKDNNQSFQQEAVVVSQSQATRLQQKQQQKEQNRLQKLGLACENEIDSLEKQIAKLEVEFADVGFFSDPAAACRKQDEYDSLRKALNTKMDEWSALQEELMEYVP